MSEKIKPAVAMNEAAKAIDKVKFELSAAISNFRIENGINQHDMHEICGISQVYMSKIETGRYDRISFERLLSACIALGLEPKLSLWGGNDESIDVIDNEITECNKETSVDDAIKLLAIAAIKERLQS